MKTSSWLIMKETVIFTDCNYMEHFWLYILACSVSSIKCAQKLYKL